MRHMDSYIDTTLWIDWREAKAFRVTCAEDVSLASAKTANEHARRPVDDDTTVISHVDE
jgi:hypothetical protein